MPERSPRTARDLVLASQVALAITLVVCLSLIPQYLFRSNEGGLTNYGLHPRTVVPFSLGLVISSALMLRASVLLLAQGVIAQGAARRLALVLTATATLTLLDLASTYPYKANEAWHVVHTLLAVLLAITELLGTAALAHDLRDPPAYAAAGLVAVAFPLMTLTFFGALHVLFAAEVVTGVGFGFLLVRASAAPGHRPGDDPSGSRNSSRFPNGSAA